MVVFRLNLIRVCILSQTFSNFFNMFIGSGELLYFFIIIALCLVSLLMALGQKIRRPDDSVAQRYTWALSGVVASWIVLMIGALFSLLLDVNANDILPPLERLSGIVTVLFLSWAFWPVTDKHREKIANIALLSTVLVAIVSYVKKINLTCV